MKTVIFKELDTKTAALRQTNVASEVSFAKHEKANKFKNQPKEMVKFFTK